MGNALTEMQGGRLTLDYPNTFQGLWNALLSGGLHTYPVDVSKPKHNLVKSSRFVSSLSSTYRIIGRELERYKIPFPILLIIQGKEFSREWSQFYDAICSIWLYFIGDRVQDAMLSGNETITYAGVIPFTCRLNGKKVSLSIRYTCFEFDEFIRSVLKFSPINF